MWRVGFGLEHLGLLAQRRPVLFSFVILAMTLASLASLGQLRFNGSVLAVLPEKSPAYLEYQQFKDDYRNFARDITVLVESDRLLTASGLQDLRDLQLELSLMDGISKAVSIFSIPQLDPDTGALSERFPLDFESDAQARALVEDLVASQAQAASLFSIDRGIAVIIASVDAEAAQDDGASYRIYRDLRALGEEMAPADFRLHFTGMIPIGATIAGALIDDQVVLSLFGLLLGTSIAFYIFRSFLAAVVCAVPPALTVIWTLGTFAIFGIEVNFLSTVLPTLALILAFADGIFLYFRWQTSNSENASLEANLTDALRRVGPASALTSLTTAVAFLSFIYASSHALQDFAWLGALAVALAFLAVILGLPVTLHWMIRLGIARPKKARAPMFQGIGRFIRPLPMGYPLRMVVLGAVICAALAVSHKLVVPDYLLTDNLPRNDEVVEAERLANEVLGGRDVLLLSVPLPEPGNLAGDANIAQLGKVERIATGLFGERRVFSAFSVLGELNTEAARQRIIDLAMEEDSAQSTEFVSRGRDHAMMLIRLNVNRPLVAVGEDIASLRQALRAEGLEEGVVITGLPALMSVEFRNLIGQLRTSLLLAILTGILFLGLATRSPLIALAAAVPNLIPIFAVETVLYFKGGTINLSEVIALTVAFGIAIDNAVHFINVYSSEREEGMEVRHALSEAIREVGPALTAGTVILCVASVVTQISALPVVPVLGRLIIITLAIALVSNVILLPAYILTLERVRTWWQNRS